MFGYSILRSTLRTDYFTALFDLLKKFDVPIEGLHTETGPGVYEVALRYGDVLTAADQAVLFKTAVKEIAYKHGVIATFMAKISENLGEAMVGINCDELKSHPAQQLSQTPE